MARISEPGAGATVKKKPRAPHKLAQETDLRHPLSVPSILAAPKPAPYRGSQQQSLQHLRSLGAPTPRQAAVRETKRAATKRREQVVSRSRQDAAFALGWTPTPRIANPRDSGVNTSAKPVKAKQLLTYPRMGADIAAIFKPGSRGVTGPIERLKAAGIIDPYGTTTHTEKVAADQSYRKALVKQIVAKQQAWQNANTSGLAVGPHEIESRVKGLSTTELEKLSRWKPTTAQAAGLAIDPSTVSGLIHGTAAGVGLLANAAGTGINKGLGLGKGGLPGRTAADLAQFPIAAVPALYDIGKSTVDTKTRKQVLSGLSHGYIGSLIRGDHPSRYFHEHPLFSALEIAGAGTGLERAIGAAGRTATKGALFGTQRVPLALADVKNTGLLSHRSYSKGALRQTVQRAIDKHLLKQGPVTTVAGRETKTNLPLAQFITDHHLNRIADYVASRATSRERVNRVQVGRLVRAAAPVRQHSTHRAVQAIGEIVDRAVQSQPAHGKTILPKGFYRPERDLVSMALEGVLRSPKLFISDLRKERARLETEFARHNMDKVDEIANRERAATIDRVLADPKAFGNGEGVFASARKLAPLFKEIEREAIRRGVLDAGKAARAKLFPTAQAHQGLVYEGALGKHLTAEDEHLAGLRQQLQTMAKNDPRREDVVGALASSIEELAHLQRRDLPASTARRTAADAEDAYQATLRKLQGMRTREGSVEGAMPQGALLRGRQAELESELAALKAQRATALHTWERQDPALQSGLVDEHRVVPNQAIRAELARQGGDPSLLTYLPHHYTLRGSKAYHQIFAPTRKNFEGTQARTGAMFTHGSSPYDYTHVLETAVGQSNKLVAIREFDHLLGTSGIRHPDGRYLTAEEANRWLRNRVDDQGNPLPPALKAVRAFSSKADKEALARIEAHQGVIAGQPSKLLEEHFQARSVLEGDTSKKRNVVLIPGQVYSRMLDHITKGRATIPALQAAQSAFRRTVLPLSVKWLTGNVLEAVLRLGFAGAGPHDPLIGRKLIRELTSMDEHVGESAKAELVSGLLYGGRTLTVRRSGQEIAGRAGAAIANAPIVHELTHTIRALTDVPLNLNALFEHGAEYAALGKFARKEMQEMTGSWSKAMRAEKQALREVAKGLLDTPGQIKAAKYLDETLGKYNRFSPQLRNIIQTYAAFLPWYLNAMRFTLHTLPAHHTFATAIIAKTEATFQADYEAQRKALEDFPSLRTAIKAHGGYVDLAHYTPVGLTGPLAAGDLSPIPGVILPQISGTSAALQGLNPFGQQLVVAKKYGGSGKPIIGGQRALIALNSLLESFVPGVTLARRLREGGKTALPTSTVFAPRTKPDTSHGQSAVDRVFNPFRPIYLHPTASKRKARKGGSSRPAGSGSGQPLAGAGGGGRLAGG